VCCGFKVLHLSATRLFESEAGEESLEVHYQYPRTTQGHNCQPTGETHGRVISADGVLPKEKNEEEWLSSIPYSRSRCSC
jgi:hypothetical protein